MGDTMRHYVERVGQRRHQLIQERGRPYGEHWRRMWGFPQPEGKDQHPGDREQARRWLQELETYGVRAVVFVTGGGNDHLAEICGWYPDRFFGFAHHSPFLPDAVDRLERAVKELGLRGYKLL